MAILVTGGAGYIGSHTVVELLNSGFEVVVVDNFSNSHPEVLKRIEKITQKSFQFYELNILDEASLGEVLEHHEIEAVIHFAGYKAVGESVKVPLKYYENNIQGTVALMKALTKYNVKKVVFSSSATVYGLENQPPFVETMPTFSATNPYGYTKVVIEHLLKDLATSDKEWAVSILRYFNPIGAHESGLIGEDPNDIPNNLMPYITQVAVGKREYLSIFGDDYSTIDGTGVRDYIHVVDLAKGHVKSLEQLLNDEGVYIYNLGTGQGHSVLEVVRTFEEASGVSIPYQIVERREGDIAESYANATYANDHLNWYATKTLFDMCLDSWNWQKNNPQGYEKSQENN